MPAVDAGPPKSRRRLLVMAGFTVVVFAIGMLAVTGIELVKGSPLNTSSSSTSERPGGTSLGSVLGRSGSTEASTETVTPSETESAEPTSEATNSEESDEDSSSAVPGRSFGTDEEGDSSHLARDADTDPESGADEQSGRAARATGAAQQQGGGAAGRTSSSSQSQAHGRSRAANAAAAARGSSASVIARTTTTRVRAGGEHLGEPVVVDAADREPRPRRRRGRHRADQVEPGRGAARLGRASASTGRRRSSRRPASSAAAAVSAALCVERPIEHVVADDLAGPGDRQVVLAEVQHVGAGGERDVGAVVDGEQRAVPGAGVGEHLERGELVARLERAVGALVAQLDDVDPAGQRGVGELGEVAAVAAGVGAQVEAGVGEAVAQRRSVRSVHGRRRYAAPTGA